jgi:Spy/CpxP family protein refolding chaperone
MNINARTLWTTLVAVLAAAVTLATLSAQPAGRSGRQGAGPEQGRLAGRGHGPGPALMLGRLNLTETQREQIRAILQEERQGDEAPLRKVGELRRDLHAAVFADSPDHSKIDQLKAEIAAAEAAALSRRIEVELRIAQVLTPEQRAQAREHPGRRGAGRRSF